VKTRLAEMAPALPKDVEIIPVHDRSNLIHSAIETLKRTLTEESIVVALVSNDLPSRAVLSLGRMATSL